MCAAVHYDSNGKKAKPKSMFSVFNRIVSAVAPKPILTTDAAPVQDSSISSKNMNLRNENIPTQLIVPDRNTQVEHPYPMSMVQNNMRQSNQSLAVIEKQNNITISHCPIVHFGSVNKLRLSSSPKTSCNESNENRTKKRKTTKTDVEMMNCNDSIDVQIKRITSQYIGKDWRMIFRDLNISDPEIDQVREQFFHVSVKEVIYQLLLRWERNCDDPTFGTLSSVLWKNKKFKCFDELKILFKERRSQLQTGKADTNGKNNESDGGSE